MFCRKNLKRSPDGAGKVHPSATLRASRTGTISMREPWRISRKGPEDIFTRVSLCWNLQRVF